MEREALGMLYDLEKFNHYCFICKVNVITDHKLLAAIFKKDVVILSQMFQSILPHIHQYNIRIMYKPGPQLLLGD